MTFLFSNTIAQFISDTFQTRIQDALDKINGMHFANVEEVQQVLYDLPQSFMKNLNYN